VLEKTVCQRCFKQSGAVAQSEMRVERLQRTVERFLQTKVLAAAEASGKKRFTEGE